MYTPKLTKQVLDYMNRYTDLEWYNSSYHNDECDSIEHEISEESFISIMLPNSFIDDADKGYFTSFLIRDTNQDILFETKNINEIINYINNIK